MNMDLLKELAKKDGCVGYEDNIGAFICEKISSFADEVYVDNLKNVVAIKKGKKKNPKKVMLFSHMDKSGFIVTNVEGNGNIRFSPVGNLDANSISYKKVCFANGTLGIIVPENANDKISYNSLYIDVGAKDKLDAEESVSVGDCFFLSDEIDTLKNDKLVGSALDGRVGAYILLSVCMAVKDNEDDLYFVFSTQKLVGNRGIKPISRAISPDMAICIDLSLSNSAENKSKGAEIGNGPILLIKDKSVICHEKLTSFISKKADELNIPMQTEISNYGSSELSVVQTAGEGVMVGGINIPCENPTTSAEIVATSDIENAEKLLLSLASCDFSEII